MSEATCNKKAKEYQAIIKRIYGESLSLDEAKIELSHFLDLLDLLNGANDSRHNKGGVKINN